jgi:serine protease AprX
MYQLSIQPYLPRQLKFVGILSITITLLVFLTAAFGQPLLPQNAQPLLLDLARRNPDNMVSVIVQKNFKGDMAVEREITKLGGIITKDLHIINALAAELPAKQAALLSTNPGVRWVSYDAPVEKSGLLGGLLCGDCANPLLLQNDYDYSVNANKVWNNSSNTAAWLQGQGVGIAVVDSGVTANADLNVKSSLSKSRLVAQVKVNNKAAGVTDNFGHGTLVSGIIAGNGSLSLGSFIGIAPQANIIGVKVSDDNGAATESDVVSGLQWVNDNKDKYNIRVVNLSMNSTQAQSYQVDPLDAACEILWFNKVTVVVSAGNNGNDGSPAVFAPANDPFVITVGAADTAKTRSPNDDTLAPFSAYGKDETGSVKPDIVAPGLNLVSTKPGLYVKLALDHPEFVLDLNYMKVAGTSFAAPQVAAAAALLLQSEPYLTPDQVKYRLKATALAGEPQGKWDTRRAWPAYDPTTMGAGYLDIYAAVTQKNLTGSANNGIPISKLLWTGDSPVNWASVNWSSVNWSSVNWSSVNWSSVNWSSVNWSSVNWSGDYWGK